MDRIRPHRVSRTYDPIWVGINELLALGLIRWMDPYIGPDDWPNQLPLPVEFPKADAIPSTEG